MAKQYDILGQQNIIGGDGGGILDDIGNFFTDDIPKFVKDHKDDIEAGAAVAAVAAGTAIGGPAGGAAAGALAKAGIQADHGNTPEGKAAAQAVIAAAAKTPGLAGVLGAAQQAVSSAIAGTAIAGAVKGAAAGDSAAQRRLNLIAHMAAQGSPAARMTVMAVSKMAPIVAATPSKKPISGATLGVLGGVGALGLLLALA